MNSLPGLTSTVTLKVNFVPLFDNHGSIICLLSTLGDASITRGDFYFGDNFSFNETLFDQVGTSYHPYLHSSPLSQLEYAANLVGDGLITIESASLQKALRINDSIARNPTFWFQTPRFLTAYAETTFPLAFFVSNQTANTTLNATLDNARSFFDLHQYPEGFYRRQAPYDFSEVSTMFGKIFDLVGVPAGHNEGVNNFVTDPNDTETVRRVSLFLLAFGVLILLVRAVVLCVPGTGQFDGETIPRSDVRARDRDQGQLGHVLQDAGRSDLRAAFPVWTVTRTRTETECTDELCSTVLRMM